MNRTDRLYALVEELRAVSPRARSARRLAERFEVSTRTIERDICALQEAGVPVYAEPGRTGGYVLAKSMSLPPLNFTPGEAAALAVAIARNAGGQTPFSADTRSALLKILAAMPGDAAVRARELAGRVRLLSRPDAGAPSVQAEVAATVRQAISRRLVVRIEYGDKQGQVTVREIEPELLMASPHGWYLAGWCRLRDERRAFRLDRMRAAGLTGEHSGERAGRAEPQVPGLAVAAPSWG